MDHADDEWPATQDEEWVRAAPVGESTMRRHLTPPAGQAQPWRTWSPLDPPPVVDPALRRPSRTIRGDYDSPVAKLVTRVVGVALVVGVVALVMRQMATGQIPVTLVPSASVPVASAPMTSAPGAGEPGTSTLAPAKPQPSPPARPDRNALYRSDLRVSQITCVLPQMGTSNQQLEA